MRLIDVSRATGLTVKQISEAERGITPLPPYELGVLERFLNGTDDAETPEQREAVRVGSGFVN